MAGIGSAPLWLQRAALARRNNRRAAEESLVAIFQRGAADGLNIVVPHGEKRYYDLRPTISVPRPGQSQQDRSSISMASSACTRRSRR